MELTAGQRTCGSRPCNTAFSFARPPAHMLVPQFHDALLQLSRGLIRMALRRTTAGF